MNVTKKTILLTGAGGTPTQNVVWCLRNEQDNFRIIGVDCDELQIHLTTGYDRKYLVPRADDSLYIDTLNQIIKREKVDLIHAQPDVEVGVISKHREQIRTNTCLPKKDVVALCHNKYELIFTLNKAGVPCANAFLISEPTDIDQAFDELGSTVWLRLIRGAGGRGSLPTNNRELAKRWVDYWEGWGSFSAEEFLPGRNLAWQGVFFEGKLMGSIAWERIRYIIRHVSPSGITGTPSIAKLINDDEVHSIGLKTVQSISKTPHGIFGVDMRENAEKVPCVTEINPGRFFTPSYMYAKAGYNLVKMFFDEALEMKHQLIIGPRAKILEDRFWIRGIDTPPVLIHRKKDLQIGAPIDE
jgi:carbamoyl-phosphate synthase large subunit